jgi:hypothetical protein
MTSASIPGIHRRSNPYYTSLLRICGRCPHHGEKRWGCCQRPVPPRAHPHRRGAHPRRALAVALGVPHSVLQDAAVRLQMSLQQADPIFVPWTYRAYGKCVPKGCWHTTGVTLGELVPPLASRWRRSSCTQDWEGVDCVEKGTMRAIRHPGARLRMA